MDDIPEVAFYMVGNIDDMLAAAGEQGIHVIVPMYARYVRT